MKTKKKFWLSDRSFSVLAAIAILAISHLSLTTVSVIKLEGMPYGDIDVSAEIEKYKNNKMMFSVYVEHYILPNGDTLLVYPNNEIQLDTLCSVVRLEAVWDMWYMNYLNDWDGWTEKRVPPVEKKKLQLKEVNYLKPQDIVFTATLLPVNRRNDYFSLMKEFSGKVDATLNSFYGPEKSGPLRELINKRQGKPKMRAFLSYLSFHLAGGKEPLRQKLSEIGAVSEMHNCHVYLDNWVFDNKNGVWQGDSRSIRERISRIIIDSQVAYHLTGKIVSKLYSSYDQGAILHDLQLANDECYAGQREDLGLTVWKFGNFASQQRFKQSYISRCEKLSGAMYGFSAWLGAFTANCDKVNLNAYQARVFGQRLGTGLQIVNDLGDMMVFETDESLKCYKDQMSDLKNGRLTLPIYLVLKNGTDKQKALCLKIAGTGETTEDEAREITKAIMETGSFAETFALAKSYFKDGKRILHTRFPKSPSRDMLSVMFSAIRSNKYLWNLRNIV